MIRKITVLCVILFSINLGFLSAQDDRGDRIGFGIGPSKLYGDNTGIHKEFKFKVMPTVTVDYSKKIDTFWDLRASIGWQMLNTGNFHTQRSLGNMAKQNQPHAFKGNSFFLDVIPVFHINPNRIGFLPDTYKIYMGTGIGIIQASRDEERFTVYNDLVKIIETTKSSTTAFYIPLRGGISKELKSDWEIALEPSMLINPSGKVDGFEGQRKKIKPDVIFQLQFFLRKNLDTFY